MKRTPPKREMNLALKLAVVASRQKQGIVATKAGMGEVRLSAIIHGRGPKPSVDECKAIAKALRKRVSDVFPTETSVACKGASPCV